MPEPTPTAVQDALVPKQICEKCRGEYTFEQFQHGVEGQECVCRRCLRVMGYPVK